MLVICNTFAALIKITHKGGEKYDMKKRECYLKVSFIRAKSKTEIHYLKILITKNGSTTKHKKKTEIMISQ